MKYKILLSLITFFSFNTLNAQFDNPCDSTPAIVFSTSWASATTVCGETDELSLEAVGTDVEVYEWLVNDILQEETSNVLTRTYNQSSVVKVAFVYEDCKSDYLTIPIKYFEPLNITEPVSIGNDESFLYSFDISGGSSEDPYFITYANITYAFDSSFSDTFFYDTNYEIRIVSPESRCNLEFEFKIEAPDECDELIDCSELSFEMPQIDCEHENIMIETLNASSIFELQEVKSELIDTFRIVTTGNGTNLELNFDLTESFELPVEIIYQNSALCSVDSLLFIAECNYFDHHSKGINMLSPNPGNGGINVVFNAEAEQESLIELFDFNGRLIHKTSKLFQEGYNEFSLDFTDLNSGMYLLKIYNNNSVYKNKIVVN